jgi:hypothetical protein
MTDAEREALTWLLSDRVAALARSMTGRDVPEVLRLDQLRRQIEAEAAEPQRG